MLPQRTWPGPPLTNKLKTKGSNREALAAMELQAEE